MECHGFDAYASESLFSKKVKKKILMCWTTHGSLLDNSSMSNQPQSVKHVTQRHPQKNKTVLSCFFKDKTTSGAIIAK